MRYSLQSRFRGALLGAALGEIWGSQYQFPTTDPLSLVRSSFNEESLKALATNPQLSCGQIVVEGVRQLSQYHQWTLKITHDPAHHQTDNRTVPSKWLFGTMAVLPIALYFHDDLTQLRHQLRQAIAIWYSSLDSVATGVEPALTSLGYAIAIALQEQLDPSDLLAELKSLDLKLPDLESATSSLNGLDSAGLNSSKLNCLDTVATWISQGMGVSTVAQILQSGAQSPIPQSLTNAPNADAAVHTDAAELIKVIEMSSAIALWSFLNTPDDFRLSVVQAARLRYHPQLTCALVGALSGAYNGLSGLPLDWRCALHRQAAPDSALTLLWTVASEENLLQLADQLVAGWAGLYDPAAVNTRANTSTVNGHHLAIAAPNVIRSR
jgi:ADP-ribosylglycohydrolase